MNKRFIWNFEIADERPLRLQDLPIHCKEELRWEARTFYPSKEIIQLKGLDNNFLKLRHYRIKHRCDSYFLLPDYPTLNIKQRRSQWLYKPLLKRTGRIRGYGKKINLADYPSQLLLPGVDCDASELLAQLTESRCIKVDKELLVYRLFDDPSIKLELARLQINDNYYYSVCIEGRAQTLVDKLSEHLLEDAFSCDYVTFLQQTLTS